MEFKSSRRMFLSSGLKLIKLGMIGSIPMLCSSCVTQQIKEEVIGPINYEPIRGFKLPSEGCLYGCYGLFEKPNPNDFRYKRASYMIDRYEREIGHKPAILQRRIWASDGGTVFPLEFIEQCGEKNVIPYYNYSVASSSIIYGSFKKLIGNPDYIKETIHFGRRVAEMKIPILITTMREINGSYHKRRSWKGQNPKDVVKLWKQIVGNFREAGADNVIFVQTVIPQADWHKARNPERFFPGDEYIDLYGLSVYIELGNVHKSLKSVASREISRFHKNHPQIPIGFGEYGIKNDKSQAKKLARDLTYISQEPRVKFLVYWNSSNLHEKRDHTLTKDSLKVIRKKLDSGYFITAK